MIGRAAITSFGMIAGGLWWSGLVSSDTVTYALPKNEVQERLEHAGLPDGVFGEEQPQGIMQSEPNRVSWIVSQKDSEVMRYIIDITPSGAGRTKVHVQLQGVTQGKFGNVDQRIQSDRTVRNLYVAAMKEQIDSVLAGHPFRFSAISGALVAAEAAHMGQIRESFDKAAEADQRRERANMDKAYRDAGLD